MIDKFLFLTIYQKYLGLKIYSFTFYGIINAYGEPWYINGSPSIKFIFES